MIPALPRYLLRFRLPLGFANAEAGVRFALSPIAFSAFIPTEPRAGHLAPDAQQRRAAVSKAPPWPGIYSRRNPCGRLLPPALDVDFDPTEK